MATYAVIQSGIVINTIVSSQEYITKRMQKRNPGLEFKQSDNVSKDFIYVKEKDTFVVPKPDDGFILDEQKLEWISPKEKPKEVGKDYVWDKETKNWKDVTRKTKVKG